MDQHPDFVSERNDELRWAVEWVTPIVSVIHELDYQATELRKLFLALISPGSLMLPENVQLNIGPAITATDFAEHAFTEIARELEVLGEDLLSLEDAGRGLHWRRVDRFIVRGKVRQPDSTFPIVPTLSVNEKTAPRDLKKFADIAEKLKGDIHKALTWDQELFERKIVGRAEKFKTALDDVRDLLLAAKKLLDYV